jgi:hypothetical protein
MHTLDEVTESESALRPLALNESTGRMEPRLALLRRSGASDVLLAHVLGVHRSAV